ncbi:MAG TPA: LysR substrate-binding domain-containing protein [Gemmatimonadaceae bacterium]|nr:LysR substrate-binding domain-containing protein [Gemmatimonadaceae bacterium]
MRVTLDALLVLDAIDRAGSFAAAAEQLYRVPSALSYTIHKLEQDLGVSIFDRSGYRAKLTAAGAQLLKDGREILHLAAQVERKVKDLGAGWETSLAIAVGDVVPRGAVYALLRDFYDTPSHKTTRLQITMEAQSTCWDTLLEGRSDLVIGAPEPAPNVEGFRTQTLGEVELALVVPATHPLAFATEPLPSTVFSQFRLIRQAAWPFAGSPEASPEDLVTVDDYDSQVQAIRHGLGVGFLPPFLVQDDVEAGRLVTKVVADAPKLRLAVAWRSAGAGQGLEWFIEQLRDRALRARLVSHSA